MKDGLKLGDVLVNKRHHYKVVFKCFVGSKGDFRTTDDFQFNINNFEKK
jgi:hypothetical protein